jgi:cytochrome c-type biogenesis protein CcmH/NrfF
LLRRVLAVCFALATLPAPGAPITAAEESPGHVHSDEGAGGPIVESPEAMKVTSVILCYCGGCVNQTLHECTCGMAASERRKVAEALEAGSTPEQLIARYIAEQGPQVRVVPERRGLNLIGWAIPYIAALSGLAGLLVVLIAWRRRGQAIPLPAGGPSLDDRDRSYLERIERDLKEVE